jgi:hypothetical protein
MTHPGGRPPISRQEEFALARVLRDEYGHSWGMIAELVGIPRGTLSVLLRRPRTPAPGPSTNSRSPLDSSGTGEERT